MKNSYELKTNYDTRKSFYKKARVINNTEKDRKTLLSYGKEVAYVENGKAIVKGTHSQTTLRHIKEFLKQEGFKAESKKQMEADYLIK